MWPIPFSQKYFSLRRLALFLQKSMKAKALLQGKQIHALLSTSGIEMNTQSLHPKLLGVYASCGDVRLADLVFHKIQNPNVFALNWMILASAFNGHSVGAIGYFSILRKLGYLPNKFTLAIILKACVGLMSLQKGKEVHAMVNLLGFQSDVSVGNALVDMYCKCGRVDHARQMFDTMTKRDVASWTSMICGYFWTERIEESLNLFERMKLEGLEPNNFTWNAMIASYARRGDSDGAFGLYTRMTREGLVPDLVTWNAMISGFTQSYRPVEAIKLFMDMLDAGIRPNEVTVTGILAACGLTSSIKRGKEIHCLVCRMGLPVNAFVGSALVDMYSKCGSVKYAWNVFNWVPIKNVPLWNSMIGCYGKNSLIVSAIQLFERMQTEGIRANEITLTCVLSACSHGGLVETGLKIFRSMKESYRVEVTKEHYACVVDLICRSGRLIEAYELIKGLSIEVTDSMVGAFFNGCKLHGRKDLAKKMADDILGMQLKRPGGFVTLSNIYAANGEWDEVENVRRVMTVRGMHKKPGSSGVDKGG